jgi:hypothetical protein
LIHLNAKAIASRGVPWMPIKKRQMYFSGVYDATAAEREGSQLATSQCVHVAFK